MPTIEVTDTNGQSIILPPAPSLLESLRHAFMRPIHVEYPNEKQRGEIKTGSELLGYLYMK